MSIASGFRAKWGLVVKAADDSAKQNPDARYAACWRAADDADLTLVEKRAIVSLMDRITELQTEIAEAREILAGTDISSLPNDYPLVSMARDRMGALAGRPDGGEAGE